ncbi:class I SAM-dependent methyltransferase [Sinorhizobium sp. RAC02]|uniref:class I SAM-dependent methyltransferase n=1 Tax=Sinorhizobium sp. RAC02 TaxID=1842534 RepID=UPI00083D3C6F|nr:class I SAM-dependent methyltransferase [Sinorhizobium sp. RAC02]AOF88978.1 methyltransferase domain protein [Sinorhizobium sp. RAC02]
MNNRYGKLASHVYNLDKYIGKSFGDVEFYRSRLSECTGAILEPAVGNGRLLIPLLEAGLQVVGFDASQEMLDYCRLESEARSLSPNLSRQTFETFAYDERFEAVIIPAGSFQLITDYAAAVGTLQRFFDHLTPNGRLIVDVDPIGSFLGDASSIRQWSTTDGDLVTLTAHRVETNYVAQTTISHLRYDRWAAGQLVASELEFFSLRWWGVEEFALALRAVGFDDVTVSGNYEYGRAPKRDDQTITFEARRRS